MRVGQIVLTCILCLAFPAVGAGWEQPFGKWIASEGQGFLYAATANDSGNIFGQWCTPSEGSCIYYLGIETQCNEGKQVPALISTNAGALAVTLLCAGRIPNQAMSRLAFMGFDDINNAINQGSRISIVFALEGDQFKVMRFELNGASAAITNMRSRAQALTNNGARPASGTKDQTL